MKIKHLINFELQRYFLEKAAIFCVIFFGLGGYLMDRYRLGIDSQLEPCLPNHSLYLIDTHDREPKKEALYAFYTENLMPIYVDGTLLLKRVKGIPGQNVIIKQQKVYIDNKEVSTGFALAKQLNLASWDFSQDFIIPKDNYWFSGDIAQSFDSRYFGTVSHQLIYGRAYPLW